MTFTPYPGRPRLAAYVEIDDAWERAIAAQFGPVARIDAHTLLGDDNAVYRNLWGFLEVTTDCDVIIVYRTT